MCSFEITVEIQLEVCINFVKRIKTVWRKFRRKSNRWESFNNQGTSVFKSWTELSIVSIYKLRMNIRLNYLNTLSNLERCYLFFYLSQRYFWGNFSIRSRLPSSQGSRKWLCVKTGTSENDGRLESLSIQEGIPIRSKWLRK